MKKLIPAYILSFIISFTLFVMEPLMLFANNRDDFHFNLSNFIFPLILEFVAVFIGLSLIYTIIYFINKKISPKTGFFNVIMIISYILFFTLYIQGNYMIGNLPKLDGTLPNWNAYNNENIITMVVFYIITLSTIICCILFKCEKVINVCKNISLAVLAMLFVGFIPTLFNSNLYRKDKVLFVSNENINKVSNNKNFLIFVIDAVDSQIFAHELNNSEYKSAFNDFTYYPDTLSKFPFTRNSIPKMLSGKTFLNETEFSDYYNEAMDSSPLIDKLIEQDYSINIYEIDNKWTTEKSRNVDNIIEYKKSLPKMCYTKNELKYVLFKYLPYFMKKVSKIQYFNLNICKTEYSMDAFSEDDVSYYKRLKNSDIEKIDDNYFSFIHIDGAHVPFNVNENIERIEDGTYVQKVRASIRIAAEYIQKLKDNDAYDNSVIIVMADHGFNEGDKWNSRLNPVLLIKGIDEHHDLEVSDKAVSYDDLMEAYLDLLDGKKSSDLFPNITSQRTRKYIWYLYLQENHEEEYITDDKAWERSKHKKTGVEYNR